MSEYTGALYRPDGEGLPLAIAIFKGGEIVAFRAVGSEDEGKGLIASAVHTLPILADEKDLPRA
jgi:hypothetical protein